MKTIDDVIRAIDEANEFTRALIESGRFKDALVLATSNRNLCELAKNELKQAEVALKSSPSALGMRIEHD